MKVLYTILFTCFVLPKNIDNGISTVSNATGKMLISAQKVLQEVSENSVKLANKISFKSSKSLSGTASFYSLNLEGTETATGETFDHDNLTAASNNFKLNSWVKVTNLRNGKSVVVRINDRMHPKMAEKGRVVDLTMTAAKKIGLSIMAGLAKVKVETVSAK